MLIPLLGEKDKMKIVVLTAVICLLSMLRAAEASAQPPADEIVTMPRFVVKDTPFNTAARIRAVTNPSDRRTIESFIILTLEPNSRLKKAGMQVGDSIVRINSTEVRGLTHAELGALMLLKKGQSSIVRFEIMPAGASTTRVVEVDALAP